MFFNINLCAVRIAHHLLKYARYALQQSTHLRDENVTARNTKLKHDRKPMVSFRYENERKIQFVGIAVGSLPL